tara:strand:- start:389 stop:910 length:522 start_codon:yes stop_codon:yes gene_type:complete
MADEIQITTTLTLETSNGVKVDVSSDGVFDQTGSNVSHHTQTISTLEELLETGLENVTTTDEGWFYIKNLGGANTTETEYITIGKIGTCNGGQGDSVDEVACSTDGTCSTAQYTNQTDCEANNGAWGAAAWQDGQHILKVLVGESVIFRAGVEILSIKASNNPTQLEIISIEN